MDTLPPIQVSPIMHLSILFFIRKSRSSLRATIYCRVTLNGQRAPAKSTHITIDPKAWDSKRQRVKPGDPKATTINARIIAIENSLNDTLLLYKDQATAKKIAETVFPSRSSKRRGEKEDVRLSQMYRLYVDLKRATTNNSKSTFEKYEQYFRNVSWYFRGDPKISDIREQHYLQFLIWLREKYKSKENQAKCAQFLRSLLNLAADRGYISGNPSTLITIKREDIPDTTHLDLNEVKALYEYDFSRLTLYPESTRKVLEEERDAIVFCCFTGMHHIDYVTKRYEIFQHNERLWLRGFRIKSIEGALDKLYEMPLHPIAESIINKYGGIDKLPVRDNSTRNKRLKLIASLVGIQINLTTKIARKTMAHYCLNILRMRQETVAAVLGLKSTKYLKHYARITSEAIDAEMHFAKPNVSVPVPVRKLERA